MPYTNISELLVEARSDNSEWTVKPEVFVAALLFGPTLIAPAPAQTRGVGGGGGGGATATGTNLSNPSFIQNLNANKDGLTYYADFYAGAASGLQCTWDASHDVGDCIQAAYNAAVAAGAGNVVQVPYGSFGMTVPVVESSKTGITIRGAAGLGNYGIAGTKLTWLGASGATMFTFDPGATNQTMVGGGAKHLALYGNNGLAGTAFKLRSIFNQVHYDVYVQDVSINAWDLDENDVANGVSHSNHFLNMNAVLTGTGAVNANGFNIGQGSTTLGNDAFDNHWADINIQYQKGTCFKVGASDSNRGEEIDCQPSGASPGPSLDLLASSGTLDLSARDNVFKTSGGFGRSSASAPVAETGTNPSHTNYVYQNLDSGAVKPVVNGSATLTYDLSDGSHWSNAPISSWRPGGNATDFAVSLPTYNPTITCNGGTIASSAPTAAYAQLFKMVWLSARLTISDGGTCSGPISVSLPTGVDSNGRYEFIGRESTQGVDGIIGNVGNGYGSSLVIYNSACWANGAARECDLSGWYQTN